MNIKVQMAASVHAANIDESEEEKIKTAIALKKLGMGYLKIPRTVLEWSYNPNKHKQMIGRLYNILFSRCNYADGVVRIEGHEVLCREGEFIATHQELADLLGISVRSVSDYIKYLVAESLIGVKRVEKRSCFIVYGYKQYMHNTKYMEKESKITGTTTKPVEKTIRFAGEEKISRGHKPRFDLLD